MIFFSTDNFLYPFDCYYFYKGNDYFVGVKVYGFKHIGTDSLKVDILNWFFKEIFYSKCIRCIGLVVLEVLEEFIIINIIWKIIYWKYYQKI